MNFHVLTLGLGPAKSTFSYAHAWLGTPEQRIFMCSGLVWNHKYTEISCAQAWFGTQAARGKALPAGVRIPSSLPTLAYVGSRRHFGVPNQA